MGCEKLKIYGYYLYSRFFKYINPPKYENLLQLWDKALKTKLGISILSQIQLKIQLDCQWY